MPALLELEGRSWFAMFEADGDFIEPSRGDLRRVKSLEGTRTRLVDLVEGLCQEGWVRRDIFFMGFSQVPPALCSLMQCDNLYMRQRAS